MKKRQLLSLIFLSVLILFGSSITMAMDNMHGSHHAGGDEMKDEWCDNEPGMKHMMKKGMDPWGMIREKLNLSDESNEKLGKIFYEYRKEMLRKGAEIEIAEMDLMWLLKTKASDSKTIKETLDKLEALKTSLNKFRVDSLLKTREFLSDEQYQDLSNYLLGWMGHHRMKGDCSSCMDGMKECR